MDLNDFLTCIFSMRNNESDGNYETDEYLNIMAKLFSEQELHIVIEISSKHEILLINVQNDWRCFKLNEYI